MTHFRHRTTLNKSITQEYTEEYNSFRIHLARKVNKFIFKKIWYILAGMDSWGKEGGCTPP